MWRLKPCERLHSEMEIPLASKCLRTSDPVFRLIAVPCDQLWLPRAHRGDIYDPCQWVLETFLTIGERLREQRLALGYSQTDFAALVGASKKTQGRWELGESSPGAEALAGWAEVGLDPLYVLVGRRSVSQAGMKEEELEQFNLLVSLFWSSSDDSRREVLNILSALHQRDVRNDTARGVRRRRTPASD